LNHPQATPTAAAHDYFGNPPAERWAKSKASMPGKKPQARLERHPGEGRDPVSSLNPTRNGAALLF
jgi:hypothetical protein